MKINLFILPLFATALMVNSCGKDYVNPTAGAGNIAGTSGSMARFAISNDHLYTLSVSSLAAYNISDAQNPVLQKNLQLGFNNIETIFGAQKNLFIGTSTGVLILDTTDPSNPKQLSSIQHFTGKDPVVANGKYAFATVRLANTGQLDVIDISNIAKPMLAATLPLTQPYGLALDGNNLFICDGGIKYYDVTDPLKPVLKEKVVVEAYDCVTNNGILMVTGKDGLYQYDYNGGKLIQLSKIATQ